jgi:hypothetical protein
MGTSSSLPASMMENPASGTFDSAKAALLALTLPSGAHTVVT